MTTKPIVIRFPEDMLEVTDTIVEALNKSSGKTTRTDYILGAITKENIRYLSKIKKGEKKQE